MHVTQRLKNKFKINSENKIRGYDDRRGTKLPLVEGGGMCNWWKAFHHLDPPTWISF